jgi:hypothetical protein
MKTLVKIFAIITVVFFATSCVKSGCTDPDAGNYDSEAENDDGSCCYNRTLDVFTQTAVLDEFATNDPVAKFIFTQSVTESCSAEDVSEIYLKVVSLVSQTVSFNFNVEMNEGLTNTIWYHEGDVNYLQPFDTLEYGLISTNPTNIEGMTFDFTGIWDVTYH